MGMTYRLTAYGKSRRPLAGVPWRDLRAAEFNAAKQLHPGIEEQGYFAEAADEDTTPPSSSRRTRKELTDG